MTNNTHCPASVAIHNMSSMPRDTSWNIVIIYISLQTISILLGILAGSRPSLFLGNKAKESIWEEATIMR